MPRSLRNAKVDTLPLANLHDDVIEWEHFPRYWPFMRGTTSRRWIPFTKASDVGL